MIDRRTFTVQLIGVISMFSGVGALWRMGRKSGPFRVTYHVRMVPGLQFQDALKIEDLWHNDLAVRKINAQLREEGHLLANSRTTFEDHIEWTYVHRSFWSYLEWCKLAHKNRILDPDYLHKMGIHIEKRFA